MLSIMYPFSGADGGVQTEKGYLFGNIISYFRSIILIQLWTETYEFIV